MDNDHIQRLLARLESGEASETDLQEIEKLLETGIVDPEDMHEMTALEKRIERLEPPLPSDSLDRRFYRMLSTEKKKMTFSWKNFIAWAEIVPSLPMASALLILGIASGYFLRPAFPADQGQIEVLTQQVSNLQEMMMLSLLDKGSPTERLKAVSLTREMDEASLKVTNALIQTLNEDENINVRLAALDALKPYAADPGVREALVRAIVKQESPLVQVSLAELMVALQERSAVKEFEKIVDSDKTPIEVRRKIRESMEILI